MSFLQTTRSFAPRIIALRSMSSGPTDGKAGAIREGGGAFGKMEVAREEEYFYKKQREQLQKLKADQITQKDFHEKQIQEHEEALQRHKQALSEIKK